MRTAILLSALLFAALSALAAQSDRSILGSVGTSSYWIDAPAGWNPDAPTARRFNAIFVLTPPGTGFDNAGAVIIGSSFSDTTVADAKAKVRASTLAADPAAVITEPDIVTVNGATISLLELRSKVIRSQPYELVAFVSVGNHVGVFTLSALAEEPFKRGKDVFMDMLKSYADAGLSVTRPGR